MNKGIAAAAAVVVLAGVGTIWALRSDSSSEVINVKSGEKIELKELPKNGSVTLKGEDGKEMKLDIGNIVQVKMAEQLDGYFKLPAGPERDKYLDTIIDQQQEMMKHVKMEQSPDGKAQVTVATKDDGKASTSPAKVTFQARAGSAAGDSLPADLKAKMAEFVSALSARRAARGLPAPNGALMMIQSKEGPK